MWEFGIHADRLEIYLTKFPFPNHYVVKQDGDVLSFVSEKRYRSVNLKTIDGNCGMGLLYSWVGFGVDASSREILKHIIYLFEQNTYTRIYTGTTEGYNNGLNQLLLEFGFKKIDSFKNKRYADEGNICFLWKKDL